MSSFTVNVSGIAPSTTQTQLHDFFTFCGKINSIEHKDGSGTATIAFEKANSARTALMLNGGVLDGSTLTVTSDVVHPEEEHHTSDQPPHHVDQSDKPRAGIAAEYLAKGYVLSDSVLQKAIEMDNKHGISKKFLDYFNNLDKGIGQRALGPEQTISGKVQSTLGSATQQAKAIDEQKGFSKIAQDYYTKAIQSPFGQKVKAFYTDTSKQVQDIHEEARRIADQEKAKGGAHATPEAAGSAEKTGAVPPST
ncbi:hypothetical protein CVT26_014118 [Gymnopilus dilepis]|uniref:RRM domain-containing protein n=1 Tax=Gymnopilus dilepis TaxID=231916 RepID=A0A409Y7X3_9AGAR|nr:hypothetical protein CVT26_014118 [Gymnopilus dilepis]